MTPISQSVVAGTIVGMEPNLFCSVLLDTGEQVQACIPKQTARLMFRIVVGDRVLIKSKPQKIWLVLGHERVSPDVR
jgi:translation initiation factor IF-1